MKIALDTNIVSELAKPHADANVLTWVRALRAEDLFLPAVCWAELQKGIRMLPVGGRRAGLERSIDDLVAALGGILPFGRAEAEVFAELASESGRPRPTVDMMIAATCRTAGFPLATRNVRDFRDCGVALIDPWVPV